MRILDADATAARLDGLVHLDTQRAAAGLDLTVDEVARLTGPGSLDFGGSEFEPADLATLDPELADPADDYGWWELEAGTYAVRYNEAIDLEEGQLGLVHPLPRLQRAGAAHAAFVVEGAVDPVETMLTVGEAGCRLKENCRISRLLAFRDTPTGAGGSA